MKFLKEYSKFTVAVLAVATIAGCTRTAKPGDTADNDSLANLTVPDSILTTETQQDTREDAPSEADHKQLEKNLQQAAATQEAMTLTPTVENRPDGVLFVLNATRNRSVGKEWMPSSEKFRVQIVSAKGGEVWNSSNNMNYMTVVGDVKPSSAGATERYEMLWPGITNNKQAAAPGKYTAQLIIPARPLPYTANVEFDWKGK